MLGQWEGEGGDRARRDIATLLSSVNCQRAGWCRELAHNYVEYASEHHDLMTAI
jgi:hypothetical protein